MHLSTEIERLKLSLAEFANENEAWRSKYEQEKYQLNSDVLQTITKLQEEKRGLEKEYMHARSQADMIETQKSSFISNVNLALQDKDKMIENLQSRLISAEDQYHKLKMEYELRAASVSLSLFIYISENLL